MATGQALGFGVMAVGFVLFAIGLLLHALDKTGESFATRPRPLLYTVDGILGILLYVMTSRWTWAHFCTLFGVTVIVAGTAVMLFA